MSNYERLMGVLLAFTCVVVIASGTVYLSEKVPTIPSAQAFK